MALSYPFGLLKVLPQTMGNIFVWLPGADPQILGSCESLPTTERKKFQDFGTLILIPATLAFASMSSTTYTLSNDPQISIAAGIIWALIVLVIEKFLVSNFYKSSRGTKNKFINNTALFLCRLALAGIVGTAVAHPFMLFLFKVKIEQKITDNKRAEVAEARRKAENEINKINTESITKDSTGELSDLQRQKDGIQNRQDKLDDNKRCLTELRNAEQRGDIVVGKGLCSGLSTTGKPDCGAQCKNFEKQIDHLIEQIKQLERDNNSITERMNQLKKDADLIKITEGEEKKTKRKNIEDALKEEIKEIEERYSYDYPARVDALAEIEKNKPHISFVRKFILLVLICIDILPVLMKFFVPIGEYELIRDRKLLEAELREKAKIKAMLEHYTSPNYYAMLRAEYSYKTQRGDLTDSPSATGEHLMGSSNGHRHIHNHQML